MPTLAVVIMWGASCLKASRRPGDVSNAGWKVICGPHAGHQCLHPALNAEDAEAAGHLTKLHQPKFALPLPFPPPMWKQKAFCFHIGHAEIDFKILEHARQG